MLTLKKLARNCRFFSNCSTRPSANTGDRLLPATDGLLPATDRLLHDTDRLLPDTDKLLPDTDREEGLREGKDMYHSTTERETKRGERQKHSAT